MNTTVIFCFLLAGVYLTLASNVGEPSLRNKEHALYRNRMSLLEEYYTFLKKMHQKPSVIVEDRERVGHNYYYEGSADMPNINSVFYRKANWDELKERYDEELYVYRMRFLTAYYWLQLKMNPSFKFIKVESKSGKRGYHLEKGVEPYSGGALYKDADWDKLEDTYHKALYKYRMDILVKYYKLRVEQNPPYIDSSIILTGQNKYAGGDVPEMESRSYMETDWKQLECNYRTNILKSYYELYVKSQKKPGEPTDVLLLPLLKIRDNAKEFTLHYSGGKLSMDICREIDWENVETRYGKLVNCYKDGKPICGTDGVAHS